MASILVPNNLKDFVRLVEEQLVIARSLPGSESIELRIGLLDDLLARAKDADAFCDLLDELYDILS